MMNRWWIPALAALSLAACNDDGTGSDDGAAGAVYTTNNAASGNYVIRFARAQDGTITRMDSVATGGRGSGPDPMFQTDPLTAQDAVIMSDDNRLLFTVNAGSNEVTSFRVASSGALTRVSTVGSGGTFPVSLALRGGVLYVVNQAGAGSISGFTVGTDGVLTPIAGSTRPLSGAAMTGAGSIRISPTGQTLVVTEKMTNKLSMYTLGSGGVATTGTPNVVAAPGPTPFGADFDAAGRYILSIGNIGPNRAAVPDGSSAASLLPSGSGAATVYTAGEPTTETAACWIQITPSGEFAYTTNTGSGTITGFRINPNGTLTRLTADGRTGVTGMGTQPLDMAYAGGYLYAVTPGDNGIHAFSVNSDGSLTALANATGVLQVSVAGLAAM